MFNVKDLIMVYVNPIQHQLVQLCIQLMVIVTIILVWMEYVSWALLTKLLNVLDSLNVLKP